MHHSSQNQSELSVPCTRPILDQRFPTTGLQPGTRPWHELQVVAAQPLLTRLCSSARAAPQCLLGSAPQACATTSHISPPPWPLAPAWLHCQSTVKKKKVENHCLGPLVPFSDWSMHAKLLFAYGCRLISIHLGQYKCNVLICPFSHPFNCSSFW